MSLEQENEPETIDNLNTDWIDEYEERERQYADFYEEPVSTINVHFVYVNRNNEIEKIKMENMTVDDDQTIKKERLLYLIKTNIENDKIKYKLLSILVYNLDIPSNELRKYLEEPPESEENHKYLYSLKILEDIKIRETITLFHDINGIYFIFYEKTKKLQNNHNSTKKIKMKKEHSKSRSYKAKTRRSY